MDRNGFRPDLSGREFELLIIGGGINGVAIARECAQKGLSVLLVEQNDFGSGTTSRSTRIIHGGLRYLEHGEVGLVRESLRERDRLLAQSPHLIRPLEFLLAVPQEERSFRRSALAIRTGLWLYRKWAGVQKGGHITDLRQFEAQLDHDGSWRVFSYEDAQCEFPERLTAEWLTDAMAAGAQVRNHTECLTLTACDGQITGAKLRDRITRDEYLVRSRTVVNATGPWADFLLKASSLGRKPLVGGVRGSHIVLPKFNSGPRAAVYTEADDHRPFFVIPWNGQTLVGTTEVADDQSPDSSQPSPDEIEYLWNNFARLFPSSGLQRTDIRYTFSGVRPLPYAPGESLSAITRRHILHDHGDEGARGLITVIGGKLTTATALAREVAQKLDADGAPTKGVFAGMTTEDGVESTLKQWAHLVACKARIPEACARAIAEWHGRRALAIAHRASLDPAFRTQLCPHSPHIVAEAMEAVECEAAVSLGDILLRRVPVALGACWSESCSQEAADKIGLVLGWSPERIGRGLDDFEAERQRFLNPRAENGLNSPPTHRVERQKSGVRS